MRPRYQRVRKQRRISEGYMEAEGVKLDVNMVTCQLFLYGGS